MKIDCVSRKDQAIFEIIIHFMKENNVNIKIIAMVELFEAKTTENLRNVVSKVIKEYNIKKTTNTFYNFR